MENKVIAVGKEAQDLLLKGVNLVADIVKTTLGPAGSNVVYSNHYNYPLVTNDGVTVAKNVYSDNEIEQQGIDLIKQSSFRTNLLAGDGTTTSIVLAQAIVQEGLKSDKNRIQLRKEINEDCAKVIEELKKTARPVASFDEIKQVATISAESEEIGTTIATAIDKIGKDGQVTVTESEISGVRVEYTQGLDIDEGMIHPYMMNTEKATAVAENPYILIVDTKLSNIKDILPVAQKVGEAGFKQLVVVCDGMDGNMIPTIIKNKQGQEVIDPKTGEKIFVQFEIIGIKFPAVKKQEFIEDIALMTGGKVFGMSTGNFPDKATLDDLGTCDRVVATLKNTTFVGCNGDVSAKIEQLRNAKESSEINKDDYDTRIARLTGQVAVIKVGAPTDSELQYLKLKIEDAVCATRAAIEEGIVRGGGMALKMIALDMKEGVLKNALQAPYNQIQENAGGGLVIGDNVFDPVKVTRYALENACSCAGTLLTVTSAIALKKIKPREY